VALHFDILTLFPELVSHVAATSILGRAQRAGVYSLELTNIRDFARDRHRSVDDRPYGGGPGMVFKPEPVFDAVEAVLRKEKARPEATRKFILSPQGRRLEQRILRECAAAEWIILLCGHYEGFDERIIEGLGFDELSIGDYVLSGGELPALIVLDGVVRLLPGALGHPDSAALESFEDSGLEYPQYTRPPEFRGMKVPDVLLSGHHREIARWRDEQSRRKTRARQEAPDAGPETAAQNPDENDSEELKMRATRARPLAGDEFHE
jgi:tRNA (guanine37-N1)-methyltransferase